MAEPFLRDVGPSRATPSLRALGSGKPRTQDPPWSCHHGRRTPNTPQISRFSVKDGSFSSSLGPSRGAGLCPRSELGHPVGTGSRPSSLPVTATSSRTCGKARPTKQLVQKNVFSISKLHLFKNIFIHKQGFV